MSRNTQAILDPTESHPIRVGLTQNGLLCCPTCSCATDQLYLSSSIQYAPMLAHYVVWCPCGTVYVKYPRRQPVPVHDFTQDPIMD